MVNGQRMIETSQYCVVMYKHYIILYNIIYSLFIGSTMGGAVFSTLIGLHDKDDLHVGVMIHNISF